MFVDSRQLPDPHTMEVDLCVVGAGPAGIAIAREFGGGPMSVALVESGAFDFDTNAQELSEVTATDSDFEAPNEISRRQFGGTANMWIVRLTRFRRGVCYLLLSSSQTPPLQGQLAPIGCPRKPWTGRPDATALPSQSSSIARGAACTNAAGESCLPADRLRAFTLVLAVPSCACCERDP